MRWHVDAEMMSQYLDGNADRVLAASVEMHVTDCADCRRFVSVLDNPEESWSRVRDAIEAPDPTWLERVLAAFGVPAPTAHLVAVAPSLRGPWFGALGLVLAFAVAMTHLADRATAGLVFGTIAPVLPVAGVAFAYGRLADPGWEIMVTTPVDRFRLLLLRVVAVTVTTFGMSLIAGLALPGFGLFGIWILPALALTAVTLVLSSRVTAWKAAVAVAAGWGALAGRAMSVPAGHSWLFGSVGQLVFAMVAVAGAVGVVLLRDSFNQGSME